ncbi:MAG: site-specific DNA-methyltransferase [Treponema sp.]|nr:site-specific DNA-methyltransferase [Treponema sp.]
MTKPKFETPDMTQKNIDKIAQLFPNCVTESKDENGKLKKAVNFELLQQMLSDEIADKDEAYEFTWVGKKAAIVEANKPIRKTLRPCKEESVNWDTTENLYIEGDNLEVLKLLQESYLGKVKMIYIDPPYNTGNDFIYRDDFTSSSEEYAEEAGLFDEAGNRMFKNTDTNGRFHSDWCSMIYSRLLLARNLLSDDGVIFISIDDVEINNLRKICDEIFGSSNFVANIIWQKKTSSDARMDISAAHDYILCFAKKRNLDKYIFNYLPYDEERLASYTNPDNDPRGVWASVDITGQTGRAPKSQFYEITTPSGEKYFPPEGRCWAMAQNTFEQLYKDNRLWFGSDGKNRPRLKKFLSESEGQRPWTWWDNKFASYNQASNKELMKLFDGKLVFDNPKPTKLLKRMISLTTQANNKDIILDFFSGSCSTADAVMQLNQEDGGNRRFLCIQIPQDLQETGNDFKANNVAINEGYKNICEIGKERIRRAGQQILNEKKSAKDVSPEQIRLLKTKEQADLFTASSVHEENDGALRGVPAAGVAEKPTALERGGDFPHLDIGFRVLKVDDSNMKDVYYSASEYDQSKLDMFESNIKEDRNDLDLLFGCLLDWGLPLSLPYTSETMGKFTVHTYNDGDLVACFNEDVSEEVVKEIARKKPLRAVFRDSSFSNSASKINVFEIFKMISPETSVKVI